jgi:hypothetical protein
MESADFKLLGRIRAIHDRIITSGQVEMEFQKNRQKLMLTSFQKLVLKERPEIPGLFLNTPKGDELKAALKQVKQSLQVLRESLSVAMKNPAAHDPVYKAASNVFAFESEFNLDPTKPERNRIRRLARRRFILGYPPRKDKDTSMGDAINWEWIVECVKKSGRSVIIVSRDGDYGLQFARESYLNEWLRQEFLERVGHKSHISLTESLSSALKQIKVRVTPAEERAEEKLIEAASVADLWPSAATTYSRGDVVLHLVKPPKLDLVKPPKLDLVKRPKLDLVKRPKIHSGSEESGESKKGE